MYTNTNLHPSLSLSLFPLRAVRASSKITGGGQRKLQRRHDLQATDIPTRPSEGQGQFGAAQLEEHTDTENSEGRVRPMNERSKNAQATMAREQKQEIALAKPYEPTQAELPAVLAAAKRLEKPAPRMKTEMVGKAQCNISVDHPDADVGFALIAEAIGGQSHEFTVGILESLGGIASDGNTVKLQRLNFALSIVRGLEAKDQTEALLGSQMAAIHIATMKTAEVFMQTTDLQRFKSIESSLNKLARTFAAQVEALKRYRSKGEQRVYVEHVNVEKGGQAIVGNVSHGGGGDGKENGR